MIDDGEQFWAFPKGTEENMRPANKWLAEEMRSKFPGASVAAARVEERVKLTAVPGDVMKDPNPIPQSSVSIGDDDEDDE